MDMRNIGGLPLADRKTSLVERVSIEKDSEHFRSQINFNLMKIPTTSIEPTNLQLTAEMYYNHSRVIYVYPIDGKISNIDISQISLKRETSAKMLSDYTEFFNPEGHLIRIYYENIHQNA